MKLKKLQNTFLALLGAFCCTSSLTAQETKKAEYNTKKWVHSIGIGLNTFNSKGIPPSRNQINYNSTQNGVQHSYSETTGQLVLTFDAKLQRKISKNYFGLLFNYYADRGQEWQGDQTVRQILSDSMKAQTIYNNQSYVNLGLNYERQIKSFKSNKWLLNASFAAGFSINRTPDRTEFDYFDSNHFIEMDSSSSGVWRLTATHFKNGFFINPSINVRYNIFKNHGIMLELSEVFQWHGIREKTNIVGKNSDGSIDRSAYKVNAFQIKISYFF